MRPVGVGPAGTRRLGATPWRASLLATAALALLAGLMPPPARAYEHRRGTASIGGQLHLGYLGGNSYWSDVFQPASGGAIRVKQYIARNRAIGLSFELQKFGESTTIPLTDESFRPDYLQMQLLMFDYYLYFNRPQKRTPYIVGSAGFYRPEIVDEGGDDVIEPGQTVEHPKEGFVARLGIGLEYFISRTFAIDGTLSGYYIHTSSGIDPRDPPQSGKTVSGMLALGVHIYTGK
ncbi:MAG: hypothetical protein V1774_12205 [Candidatus Eisenbacteria bacterium]